MSLMSFTPTSPLEVGIQAVMSLQHLSELAASQPDQVVPENYPNVHPNKGYRKFQEEGSQRPKFFKIKVLV